MPPFTVHWAPVRKESEGAELFALWPSPMNDDACFRAAGFTDFGDGDDNWDANAEGMLTRLLEALGGHGPPRLMSKPVEKHRPWYRRWFADPEVFALREQIELPLQWDELPDCVVGFGDGGVTLRTGGGHHIFWITLPGSDAAFFPEIVSRIAAPHPLVRTNLKWEGLV